ncbi:conserved hypothetical protein [uncultured Eubacteriales bacterium]|uniref:GH29D-like beta-sandwich domain-containing protein n=1 Tax=uncultured Eubacteriales bacterium TaxID=172733 RepID=A0A212JSP1_9FIRM|nr:conserved hypothetical protein [uncultured Eubacteriales bacterium]
MAINLTSKFSEKVAERFTLRSLTDSYAGKDYDFSGVKSIKIYSVDSVPVGDYTRSGTARFGNLVELGDTLQEMVMTQDKGFTFSVDAGNAAEQLNIKQVTQRLKRNWDERATPLIDMYRFSKWMNGAGLVAAESAALTKSNIVEKIMIGTAAMSNALVPLTGRTLFIRESVYINVKLASEIVGIDKLGGKSVGSGVVGELDGMSIVRVPDSYFPAGVNFFIKYKNATVDPMKLKTLRVQKNPMGIDGDVAECRFMHDSFTLGTKVNGLYVDIDTAKVVANTAIAVATGKATITSATSGAAIKYTTDGTDPKTSTTAADYSAAVDVATGTVVRAYAAKAGLMNSGVTEVIA